jgi:hypothetical protein
MKHFVLKYIMKNLLEQNVNQIKIVVINILQQISFNVIKYRKHVNVLMRISQLLIYQVLDVYVLIQ